MRNPIAEYEPALQNEITAFILKVLNQYPSPPRRFNRMALSAIIFKHYVIDLYWVAVSLLFFSYSGMMLTAFYFQANDTVSLIGTLLAAFFPQIMFGSIAIYAFVSGTNDKIVRAIQYGILTQSRIISSSLREIVHPLGNFQMTIRICPIWKNQVKEDGLICVLADPDEKNVLCDVKIYDLQHESIMQKCAKNKIEIQKKAIRDALLLLALVFVILIIFIEAYLYKEIPEDWAYRFHLEVAVILSVVGFPVVLIWFNASSVRIKLAEWIYKKKKREKTASKRRK